MIVLILRSLILVKYYNYQFDIFLFQEENLVIAETPKMNVLHRFGKPRKPFEPNVSFEVAIIPN